MRIPQAPPPFLELTEQLGPKGVAQALSMAVPTVDGKYLHWDELRHRTPPGNLSHEEWWIAIKFARSVTSRRLPLLAPEERYAFSFSKPDELLELVHDITRDASGQIQLPEPVTNPAMRDSYLLHSLVDEAITSSQLEGAATTRQVAKQMLRTGRPPLDRHERMILNNFEAIQFIREIKDQELTPDLVLRLHRIVTEEAIDNPDAAGRFRLPREPVGVWDESDGTLLHHPPPAAELPHRMEQMCKFANGETPGYFLEPVLRAVILHFWLAYDHPFVDGNGRTARALFYWAMLHGGYWLCEFISVSRVLKKTPALYYRSFLYAETDEGDMTYFVLHQLRTIAAAIERLQDYVRKKMEEARSLGQLLRQSATYNHRQIALLTNALKNPAAEYTARSHAMTHNVNRQTARSDLKQLVERGVLRCVLQGRRYVFSPVPDLGLILRKER